MTNHPSPAERERVRAEHPDAAVIFCHRTYWIYEERDTGAGVAREITGTIGAALAHMQDRGMPVVIVDRPVIGGEK